MDAISSFYHLITNDFNIIFIATSGQTFIFKKY